MANAILWGAAWNSEGNVLTTELNSLGIDALSAAGTAFTNNTARDTFGMVEVNFDPGSTTVAPPELLLYMEMAPGGTNYSTLGGASNHLVAIIPCEVTANAQRLMSTPFQLFPGATKFRLENRTGVAFPASSNTVELFTANMEIQ